MVTGLLLLARGVHLASGMMLVTVLAFRWVVLVPAFSGGGVKEEAWRRFDPFFARLGRIFVWAGVALVVSGLALFWAVAAGMSGTSLGESLQTDTLGTVLFQTQFGRVFQLRSVLLVGLALLAGWSMWRRGFYRRGVDWGEIAAGVVAAALTVSFSWTGHAAAHGSVWNLAADALHLFAACVWPAGLLPFALFVSALRKADDGAAMECGLKAVRRFSEMSLIVVAVLVLTGIVNSCFLVGSFPALVGSLYGRILCLKLALLAVILGLAGWNRWRLLPLLADEAGRLPRLGRLRSFVLAEFSLAMGIIAVVAVLGTTPPPH